MSRRTIAAILFSVGLILSTGSALAQTQTPSVASCNDAAGVGSTACTLCSAVTLGQNIINFAIFVSFPIAAILFGWAGFLYMTSVFSAAQITKAHQIFRATAIGFMCVLGCWIIVDAVIHQVMLNSYATYFQSNGGNWYSVPSCAGLNRPTTAKVSDLLNGLFAPSNPNAAPIAVDTSGGVDQSSSASTAANSFGGQCTQSCSQGQICDPSNNVCVDGSTGLTCPGGSFGDYETGKCTMTCSAGQQYDWSSGNCVASDYSSCSSSGSADQGDVCTSTGVPSTSASTANGTPGSSNPSAQAAAAAADSHNTGSNNYEGLCLQYVRQDLCTGGFSSACTGYGQNGVGLMQAVGYQSVQSGSGNSQPSSYTPQAGDVVNLTYTDSSGQAHSHWEIYSASGNWTSDAIQNGFNAYKGQPTVNYSIYRHS